ncbi:MAG: hypothetical protein GY953_20430, partial [bacterium]|nr:hypothetical protein [bacterium]
GTVFAREDTGASTGGSEHRRGSPIYRCRYRFEGPDGQEYEGASYGTGGHMEGAEVVIEFPVGTPSCSRIRGMRPAVFPIWTLFVVLFPAIGLAFMYAGLRRGRKANRLLMHGQPALARLIDKKATNTRVNNRRVYKLTFEFDNGTGGKQQMVAKTHAPENVEDEELERLVFDPWNPSYAVLLDNLPASPEIDEIGEFRPIRARRVLASVFIPLATVLG